MYICIIGCGRVSEIHMRTYQNVPEAQVISVLDINSERANAFSRDNRNQKSSKPRTCGLFTSLRFGHECVHNRSCPSESASIKTFCLLEESLL